ncbi:hypothetical protein LP085_31015, partial [Achromobacter sp. MY14]|nr:hypothetical protein [Achromobacter sp. MY14]
RDEAGQLALTGKTAAETIASLNRDTTDTLNALKPIFDKEKIEAGFEIASEAQRQVGQFLTNRAKEKQAAEKALSDAIETGGANDAASMSALMDQAQRAQDWSAGGKYGLVLLALSGAAGANVTGSTSAFVQSAAVNYLQGLGAAQVKQIADSLGRDPQAEAARAALHGIVGCAGAAGQGAACASGALGASAGSILNSLMGSPEGLTPEQVEARRNLVTSLVAGIASAAGADAATAGTAAELETSQNWGQLAIPAVSAAAAKCATTPSCQRAVTYVSDKTVYVAVQMKDGAIYVGTAALVGITAASDAVGNWVSEFVGSAVGRETALPGKPGDVVRVDTPPPLPSEKETFGSEIPSWPGEPVQTGGTPGYEADTVQHDGGSVTPLPEQQTPTLILNVSQVDKAIENVIEGMSNTTGRGSEYVNWTGSGGIAAAQNAFDSLPAIAGTSKKYPNGAQVVTLTDGSTATLYPVSTSTVSPSIQILRPEGVGDPIKIRF